MAFEKGKKKTGGRKKGVKNKSTAQIKEAVANFVSDKFEVVSDKFDKMTVKEQADFLIKLMPFAIEKKSEKKIGFDDNTTELFKSSMENLNKMFTK